MTQHPAKGSEAQLMWDMVLYQAVTGARRARLDGDWCGYELEDQRIPCFAGHEHFDDEQMWAQHCPGPSYSTDTDAIRQVEQLLVERGCINRYVRLLLPSVYPNWDNLELEVEV